MNARRLHRPPQWITTILRRHNTKWCPQRLVRWTYGSGFRASGNGEAVGHGSEADGRPDRIPELFGFEAAGVGTAVIVCGCTDIGGEKDVEA
jgi:hypothetical protein